MKIIIVGAGKVGIALVSELCRESHEISVIDPNPDVIDYISTEFDVFAIEGTGCCCEDLKSAGADRADLLIASSSLDEINILACTIAKKMGTKRCIARIRDPKLSSQFPFLREELGLTNMVNPELYAANEISRIIRTPAAVKVESFAKGRIDLAEIKITQGSRLDGVSLYMLPKMIKSKLLICAVERGSEVMIPSGDFALQAGDHIHVTATHQDLAEFFKEQGTPMQRIRSVLIIGGGRIAYYLTRQMLDSGISVKIIEINRERCLELSNAFPKAKIICADGTDQDLLIAEGLCSADACVALTGIDEENIILSMYAASQCDAKVITKVSKKSLRKMTASVGLDSLISPQQLTANMIVQYVRGLQNAGGSSITTLHKLVDNRVEAIEFTASGNSKILNVPLKELKLKRDLLIAGIIRGNKVIIPNGDVSIMRDDSVVVVTTNRYFQDLDDIVQ